MKTRPKVLSRVTRTINLLAKEISCAKDVEEIRVLSECLQILNTFEQNKLAKLIEKVLLQRQGEE